jgi:hypothetical protein
MAKVRDKVWFCDPDGEKVPAVVTKAQTFVDGLPASDSYDAETVDVVVHDEQTDEGGIVHSKIVGGHSAVKQAKTATDQQTPGRWWPRS